MESINTPLKAMDCAFQNEKVSRKGIKKWLKSLIDKLEIPGLDFITYIK